MRVSEILDNPIINLPSNIQGETNTLNFDGPIYIRLDNVNSMNNKRYTVILIDNGLRTKVELPIKLEVDKETRKEYGIVEIYDGIMGVETQGIHTIAILSNKTGKVVANEKVVITHSTLRVIIDELYLSENSEGRFEARFTNDPAIYGDLRINFYNAEKATKVAKALGSDQYSESMNNVVDSPNVLVVAPDGSYKAGEAGNIIIGVHLLSENAGMNKIQLINIVVNDSRSVNIDEINRIAEAIERGELVKRNK